MPRQPGRLSRPLIGGLLSVAGVAALAWAVAVSHDEQHRPAAFTITTSPAAPVSTRLVPPAPSRTTIAQPFQADRLQIEALRVDASVSQIFSSARELLPPADPHVVGWWAGSMLPGSIRGATVLTGHVDTAADGLGALYALDKVRPGMVVRLSGTDGVASYRIASLASYPKTTGLPPALFTTTGTARLVLISCGGSFDTITR